MTRSNYASDVWGRAQFDTEVKAKRLVEYLIQHPRFAPDAFGAYEPLKRLTERAVPKAIGLVVDEPSQQFNPNRIWNMVLFRRSKNPECSMQPTWTRLLQDPFSMSLYSTESDFLRDSANLSEWHDFMYGLIGAHDGWFARFCLVEEIRRKHGLMMSVQTPARPQGVSEHSLAGQKLHEGIPGVYWGNYFGPFYVDWFGRAKFETLPCVEKRWLSTGGMFFTTAPTPFDWDTPQARTLEQAVKDHLDPTAFFDINVVRKVLEGLGPVPPDFEPQRLQPPRHVPCFPFTIVRPVRKPVEEEVEDLRRFLEPEGFKFVGSDGRLAIFRDRKGGITRITLGAEGRVEYWPKT